MNPRVALLGFLVLGACGSTEPARVDLTIVRPCEKGTCQERLQGEGVLFVADHPHRSDLARARGDTTLYAEVHASDHRVILLEIAYGRTSRVRYRELENGKVAFRGQVEVTEVIKPTRYRVGVIVFKARDGDALREVSGEITFSSDRAGEDSESYDPYGPRQTEVYGGCGGEIVIVDSIDPEFPIEEEPIGEPPVVEPPVEEPYEPPVGEPYEPPVEEPYEPPPVSPPYDPGTDDTGGCSGDDSDTDSEGGCDGADDDDSGGGCSGDDTASENDGCNGDSSDSGGSCGGDSKAGKDRGCEGDGAQAAAAPLIFHAMRGLWGFLWPVLPAAVFNRTRRRRSASEGSI